MADITPSPLNPRKTFEADELAELANSIKENGLIQPITVRKTKKGSEHKYEIVCGERRYRACQMNDMGDIEAVVKDLDDRQSFLCMVLENLQRKEVDPLEEAAAIRYLYKDGEYKVAEIAKTLGKSSSYVVGRIQLTNIIPEFAALLRSKELWLIHLQEIAKLGKEQQRVLYEACFTPECIARWPQKILKMEALAAMINEHVMNRLDMARFSITDPSYKTCHACEGCKFNTATFPKKFADKETPCCMKREFFMAKNREAVVRKAKASGIPVVYVGTEQENEAILNDCKESGLAPTSIGNRQYVVLPTEPQEEAFNDKDAYAKRRANYEAKKASFDDNIKDGTIMEVYEVSFNGKLSGEVRYLYNTPVDDHGDTTPQAVMLARNIDTQKRSLYESGEKEQAELTEARRVILADSDYSVDTSVLSENEEGILLAVMLKRMGYKFKQSIGVDLKTSLNIDNVVAIAKDHRNSILREFIKMNLSEESVGYAADLAKLLTSVVEERMAEQADTAAERISKEWEAKRTKIREGIATNQEVLRGLADPNKEETPAPQLKEEALHECVESAEPTQSEAEPKEP